MKTQLTLKNVSEILKIKASCYVILERKGKGLLRNYTYTYLNLLR